MRLGQSQTILQKTKSIKSMLRLLLLVVTLMWLSGNLFVMSSVSAQDTAIEYLRYDVDIHVKANGDFTVTETQQVQFYGEYRTAFAEIPRAYTTDIDHIAVWQDGEPLLQKSQADEAGTFSIETEDDNVYVNWRFEETAPGDVRQFVLQYDVFGGLWVYADQTTLEWRAVPADRGGIPVLESRVTVYLPDVVSSQNPQYTAYGPEYDSQVSANQVSFTATEPIPDGTRFQVRVGFPPQLTSATVQSWQVVEDTAALEYRLLSMDVELVISEDGLLSVSERQNLAVDSGAMHFGRRSISLAYLDDVTNVRVFEGEQQFTPQEQECQVYCLQVERRHAGKTPWIEYNPELREVVIDETRAGEVDVLWEFPALVKGEETSFRLQYQVTGAIRFVEKGQQLNWVVVFPEHDVPIESASVRLELPPHVDWANVTIDGGQMAPNSDGSVTLKNDGPIPPGRDWRLSVTMPAQATSATKPEWQVKLEAAEQEARKAATRLASQQLGFGLAGVLILVIGLLAVYLVWLTRGRDQPVITDIEYIAHPPSNLPPGIVAFLMHERPTAKGALSSLVHLASLGLLSIQINEQQLELQRSWDQEIASGQSIQQPSGETVTIPDHLVTLFNAIRPAVPIDKFVPWWTINREFKQVLPAVYVKMAEEASLLFTERPALARYRWQSFGQGLVLASIVVSVGAWLLLQPQLGPVALAPPLALLVTGLILMLTSRWMPQRSTRGAEERAGWQAFQNYLRHLKDFGDTENAQRVLDDYFAYAVALDVEEIVLEQAANLGSLVPVWTQPITLETLPNNQAEAQLSTSSSRPVTTGRPVEPPESGLPPLRVRREYVPGTSAKALASRLSLQAVSLQIGRTLSSTSRDINDLLSTAVGQSPGDTPFRLVLKGAGKATEMTWKATTATFDVIGDILEESASGGGSGDYGGWSGGNSSHRSSSRSSWSSSSSRRSRSSSGRSSSSRRSGGGGRRGFG